jgi:3-deoxy-D-manno-octulosonic-acid transferase
MPPLAVRLALAAYGGLYRAATPLLPMIAPRLREGFAQRALREFPSGPFDLWMQAASGGEAYLALEILRRLPESARVLVTTNTRQGLD